jgi:hypothetical protein
MVWRHKDLAMARDIFTSGKSSPAGDVTQPLRMPQGQAAVAAARQAARGGESSNEAGLTRRFSAPP